MTTSKPHSSLFAVLFEVEPDPARFDEYIQIAAALRPKLIATEGFLDNERFRSQTRPGVLLSLSLWENEKALVRWRTEAAHHGAQAKGRNGVLAGYQLRVGEATLAAGRFAARRELGWMRHDETEAAEDKAAALIAGGADLTGRLAQTAVERGALQAEAFTCLTDQSRVALLTIWRSVIEAEAFARLAMERVGPSADIYAIRTVRSYGMVDRFEAPQHHV
jgi:heme-degrading monooxygenase HmoA